MPIFIPEKSINLIKEATEKMINRVESVYDGMAFSRVCLYGLDPYISFEKDKTLRILPNFEIKNNQIYREFSEPLMPIKDYNSFSIARVTKYDHLIQTVNEITKDKEKASGFMTIYQDAKSIDEEDKVSHCSYVIAKYHEKIFGLTCLHITQGFDISETEFFISTNEYDSPSNCYKKFSKMTKVTIPENYLELRKFLLNNCKEIDELFHDDEFNLHPYPTLDLLIFKLPEKDEEVYAKNSWYYTIESNETWYRDSPFVFFSCFQVDRQIKRDDEYLNSIPKKVVIKSKFITHTDMKSITFGEINTFNAEGLRTANFVTLPGSSGAGVINKFGNLVGITGLSYYDRQINKKSSTKKSDKSISNTYDIPKEFCSEKITNNDFSFNFNIITSVQGKLFRMLVSSLDKEVEGKEFKAELRFRVKLIYSEKKNKRKILEFLKKYNENIDIKSENGERTIGKEKEDGNKFFRKLRFTIREDLFLALKGAKKSEGEFQAENITVLDLI